MASPRGACPPGPGSHGLEHGWLARLSGAFRRTTAESRDKESPATPRVASRDLRAVQRHPREISTRLSRAVRHKVNQRENRGRSSDDPNSRSDVALGDIVAARKRISGLVLRTPLVRLDMENAPAEVYLKLENLQPTGSFKVRGAGNAISLLSPAERKRGVYTCSAGNMAQALAWHAQRLGIPCTVIMPDTAPQTKLAGVRRFGANIVQLSWDEVWKIGITRVYEPLKQMVFVHPFSEFGMIAGNGTIGLEILEDLPNVDAVIVPYGGGGLIGGIATAIKARRPKTKMYACEPETAAPLAASFAIGSPREFKRIPSFVDGSGASSVLPEMWGLNRPLLSGSIVVSLREVASAIKLLVERHRVVAEGAGGSSVAAALTGKAGRGRVVAVVSGGNIDAAKLTTILNGQVP